MTDPETNPVGSLLPPEPLRQSKRDRWANTLAATLAVAHFFAELFVIAWYYFIVPRRKFEVDHMAFLSSAAVSPSAVGVIVQSDLIVNYWYFLVFMGPPFLIADFMMMRWMAKQLGLSTALLCGMGITALILWNYFHGNYVITQELSRLRVLAEASGQTISP